MTALNQVHIKLMARNSVYNMDRVPPLVSLVMMLFMYEHDIQNVVIVCTNISRLVVLLSKTKSLVKLLVNLVLLL